MVQVLQYISSAFRMTVNPKYHDIVTPFFSVKSGLAVAASSERSLKNEKTCKLPLGHANTQVLQLPTPAEGSSGQAVFHPDLLCPGVAVVLEGTAEVRCPACPSEGRKKAAYVLQTAVTSTYQGCSQKLEDRVSDIKQSLRCIGFLPHIPCQRKLSDIDSKRNHPAATTTDK